MRPDLMLLPQQSHEAVVLLAGAWGERGGPGARQGVVILTDRSAGNLSGNVMRKKMRGGKKEVLDIKKKKKVPQRSPNLPTCHQTKWDNYDKFCDLHTFPTIPDTKESTSALSICV